MQVLPPGATVTDRLLDDVRVMLAHALNTGRRIPPAWVEVVARAERDGVNEHTLRRLAAVHDDLAALVAPATPRSLHYLEDIRSRGPWRRGIPLLRLLTVLAVFFLFAFVILATNEDVSSANADVEKTFGMILFLNLMYLISSAGMGATFAGLFAVNKHLNDFSYDPRYASSYWVRILLGVTAGLILAELVPFGQGSELGRPLLALLGGFGVEVVYRLLQRLVDVASSLVSTGPSPADAAAAENVRAQQREGRVRLDLARELARLRGGVETKDPALVASELDALIAEVSGGEPQDTGGQEPEGTPYAPAVVTDGETPFAPGDTTIDLTDAAPVVSSHEVEVPEQPVAATMATTATGRRPRRRTR